MAMSQLSKVLEEMDQDQRQSPVVQALLAIDDKLERLLNLFANFSIRQDRLEASIISLCERKVSRGCVFCPDSGESHQSGRCSRFPDSVSRAVQAFRLGLCERCLRAGHDEDCGIT